MERRKIEIKTPKTAKVYNHVRKSIFNVIIFIHLFVDSTHTYTPTHTHTLNIHIYIYIHTNVHNICIYKYTYTHARTHTHTHTHIYIRTHIFTIYVYIYIYIHVYTRTYTHAHTDTHTHSHTYIYIMYIQQTYVSNMASYWSSRHEKKIGLLLRIPSKKNFESVSTETTRYIGHTKDRATFQL